MRLRTLPVSVAGVLAACGYAVGDDCFDWLPALLCLLFAVLCQIASNFANEYFDYRAGRDRVGREGPRRGVTEGDITPKAMLDATLRTLSIAAGVGMCLTLWGGLWLIPVGLAVGLGVFAYSAGPWPLSTHCLGEVAVVVFFGIVPVNLTYYIMASQWSMPVFLGSVAIGLMGANVLIVNNYRDADDDRAVGKHTLATVFGRRLMPWLYVANAVAAVLLMADIWPALGALWVAIPSLYLYWSISAALRIRKLAGARLNPYLGITSMGMFAYSLLFLISEICASL